jgi:histidinol-phosphatase (PHP family)
MKSNFHTHHELCRHASGRCEDYVIKAIQNGFRELGFSDHVPDSELPPNFRMLENEYDQYLQDIKNVQMAYSNKLTIYAGIESEFFFTDSKKYEKLREELDYLIVGLHWISMTKNKENLVGCFGLTTKEELHMYADHACAAMRSGYFTIFAHPDLFLHAYPEFDEVAKNVSERIIQCAEETQVILEYNANGYRRKKLQTKNGTITPYPRTEFWNIAEKYNVRTILSSDCHSPNQLYDDTVREAEEVYQFLNTEKVEFFNKF